VKEYLIHGPKARDWWNLKSNEMKLEALLDVSKIYGGYVLR
jgi:hypothetical protein